jgi:SNF2 family DNA or RNA helicase
MIKNPQSQVTQAAYRLRAGWRLNLSGTPVENSLEDLWSQARFLNPGLLGTRGEFERRFIEPILRGEASARAALKRRVGTFTLRRLKRDVARELPPKTDVVVECELTEQERTVYGALVASTRSTVEQALSENQGLFSVLEVLLRLRQACCHIALIPGQVASRSSKVDLLVECLSRSREGGHRALVFSQWTSLLDLVEPALREGGITFDRIDGSTSNRGEIVDRFQRLDGPDALLLSLKAGGVGLTLTAADHVYLLDPWWNPAVEEQAADRAYRIGQTNPVIVHRLVARDTVEERVLELQAVKRGLLDAVSQGGGVEEVTREEIVALLDAERG